LPASSEVPRTLLRSLGAAAALAGAETPAAVAQSPREANPERPTFATHAYGVAPGYAELEQGLSARGVASLREETSWDVNLKFGASRHAQVAIFGPLYARTAGGHGIRDLGVAVKLRTALSLRAAAAVVTSVTAPTGSTARGLGAGRALGALTAVLSADLPQAFHIDLNAGPQGIGAGEPHWFLSIGGSRSFGRAGIAVEVFQFTPGGAGSRLAGVLGAVTLRPVAWVVVDAGGVARTTSATPDQVFLGVTTNFGRLF